MTKVSRATFGLCLAVLFILLYIYRYDFPSADDFGYIISGQTFTPLETAVDLYLNWNGRLAANYFYALFLQELNLNSYRIITATVYILFCLAFLWLCRMALRKLDTRAALYTALLLLVTVLTGAAHLPNTFYWMGGVANYIVSLVFFMSALALTLWKRGKPVWLLPSALLIAVSGLCNETFTVAAIWFLLVAACAALYTGHKRQGAAALTLMAVLFGCLLVMFLSPGNHVRVGEEEAEAGRFFWAVWTSLMTTLERSGEWLVYSPLIPAALLAGPALKDVRLPLLFPRLGVRTHGFLLLAYGITCVWAAHFTISFARGYYGLPDRAKFVAQFFFYSLAFAALIYIFCSFRVDEKLAKGRRQALVLVVFCLMLLCTRHFGPSIMYAGKFGGYYNLLRERYTVVATSDADTIVFEAAPLQPPMMRAVYFGLKCGESIDALYKGKCARLDGRKDGYANYKLFGK